MLTWTREAPTVPGRYLMRQFMPGYSYWNVLDVGRWSEPMEVEFVEIDGMLHFNGMRSMKWETEWSGPIAPPGEAGA